MVLELHLFYLWYLYQFYGDCESNTISSLQNILLVFTLTHNFVCVIWLDLFSHWFLYCNSILFSSIFADIYLFSKCVLCVVYTEKNSLQSTHLKWPITALLFELNSLGISLGISGQTTRPRPDPVLFQWWGSLNLLLIATEMVR